MSQNTGILSGEQAAEIETDAAAEQELFERRALAEREILRVFLTQLLRKTGDPRAARSFRFVEGRGKRSADSVAVRVQLTEAIQVELTSEIVNVPFKVGDETIESVPIFMGSFGLGVPESGDREEFLKRVDIDALREPECAAALKGRVRLYNEAKERWEDHPYSCESGDGVVHHTFDLNRKEEFDGTASLPFVGLIQQATTYDPRARASRSGGRRYSKYAVVGGRYTALPKSEAEPRDAWRAGAMLIAITPPLDLRDSDGKVTGTRELRTTDKTAAGGVLGTRPIRLVYVPNSVVLDWGGESMVDVLVAIHGLINDLMSILCDGMESGRQLINAKAGMIDYLKAVGLWQDDLFGFLTRFMRRHQELRDFGLKLVPYYIGAQKRLAAKVAETPKPAQGGDAPATDNGAANDDTAFEPVGEEIVGEGAEATDSGEEIVDESEHQPVQGTPANDDTAFEPVGSEEDEIIEEDGNAPSDDDSRPFVETPMPAAGPANEQAFEPVDDSNFLQ